jgi:sec-independent protein translocase protein TatB
MLDIGFWELLIIGVVGLLVIGPERLPAVARNIGYWFGKTRGFINNIKSDLDKEFRVHELQKQMSLDDERSSFETIGEEIKSSIDVEDNKKDKI